MSFFEFVMHSNHPFLIAVCLPSEEIFIVVNHKPVFCYTAQCKPALAHRCVKQTQNITLTRQDTLNTFPSFVIKQNDCNDECFDVTPVLNYVFF